MKKRVSVILLIVFLLLPTLPIRAYASGKYVASRNSDVYHYASCSYVSSISERNKIWFNSAEAAEATGRRGCSRCRPSAKSETSNQAPATPASKSYSQSDINEAYANGHADGYLLGKDVGYDSGYEAARNELEAEYQKKLDDAVSDASSSAYALSAYLGIPAACVVCTALLNKQEMELKKKYNTHIPH